MGHRQLHTCEEIDERQLVLSDLVWYQEICVCLHLNFEEQQDSAVPNATKVHVSACRKRGPEKWRGKVVRTYTDSNGIIQNQTSSNSVLSRDSEAHSLESPAICLYPDLLEIYNNI